MISRLGAFSCFIHAPPTVIIVYNRGNSCGVYCTISYNVCNCFWCSVRYSCKCVSDVNTVISIYFSYC